MRSCCTATPAAFAGKMQQTERLPSRGCGPFFLHRNNRSVTRTRHHIRLTSRKRSTAARGYQGAYNDCSLIVKNKTRITIRMDNKSRLRHTATLRSRMILGYRQSQQQHADVHAVSGAARRCTVAFYPGRVDRARLRADRRPSCLLFASGQRDPTARTISWPSPSAC